jgi:hypothetical protein
VRLVWPPEAGRRRVSHHAVHSEAVVLDSAGLRRSGSGDAARRAHSMAPPALHHHRGGCEEASGAAWGAGGQAVLVGLCRFG